MRKFLFLVLAVAVVLSLRMNSSHGEKSGGNEVAGSLDLFLQRAAAFGFSGAFLISQDGKVQLSKGYGYANREKAIRVNAQTPFSVASITKPFTATGILKLGQTHKLKVTDSITKYFSSVPFDKTGITIHHLLSHQSGLDDLYAAAGITDRDEAVQKILMPKLIAQPGQQYSYSNDGYALLAAIIEIVSGKTFAEFLREELFKPAGMNHTGFFGERGMWPEESVAHGYNMETDNGSPALYTDDWGDRGSGDLISTVEDLHRWDLALRENKILPFEIQEKMYAPHAKMPNGWHYGYGWMTINTPRATRELYHGGGDVPRGFTAAFQRYTNEGITTIVLVNSMMDEIGLRNAVRDPVQSLLFGGEASFPPPIHQVTYEASKYEGVYELPGGSQITIKNVRDQLVASPEGQEAMGMLVGYKPDLKVVVQKFNERLATTLESLQKNSEAKDFKVDPWKEFLENKSHIDKFEVLGTWPVSSEREIFTTYARIQFTNEQAEVFRWVWNEGKLSMILSGTNAPPAPLTIVTPGKFVTYHLLMKTRSLLDFEVASNEKTVTLKSDYGIGIARRIE